MSTRDNLLRPAIYWLKKEYNIKESLGALDSNEQCKEALEKLFEIILEQSYAKEKEKLYDLEKKLRQNLNSEEMEVKKYKRNKEKISKEINELKQKLSVVLKENILHKEEIKNTQKERDELQEENILQKDEINSLQNKIISHKEEILKLKDVLYKADNLANDLTIDNERLEDNVRRLEKAKEKLEDQVHDLQIELEENKPFLKKFLEGLFW